MYATIADIAQIPDGAHRLEQVGTGTKAVLAFWETEQDAKEASDQVYEVEDSWTGPSVDDAPVTCVLLHFDGPVSQARWDAGKYAHEHRIKPLLRGFDGYVRGYTLVDAVKRSLVVVGLGTSFEKTEEIGKAVNSMELLPEEDPATLQGCDRMELYRVN
ncbi:hypothetical protein FKR81_38740 [Lentzea tibetensis]|uniref:Uncharacterized protein n=1 Tax=Lentzea tibetensis TaxID=2591470 RepID=A0A563EGS4_9PSEU|nr:hypothetical protein [Lentzea tibetensis]TWP45593.1 hypothetical protein FKR81_38740 [Lentzea tibetensis]